MPDPTDAAPTSRHRIDPSILRLGGAPLSYACIVGAWILWACMGFAWMPATVAGEASVGLGDMPPLPETVAEWEGGAVTRAEYRAAVLARAARKPAYFDLPAGYLNYHMILQAMRQAGLRAPRQDEIEARFRLRQKHHGGKATFEALLERHKLTADDMRRAIALELAFEAVALGPLGLGPATPAATPSATARPKATASGLDLRVGARLSPAIARDALEILRARYRPTWRNLDSAPIPATIAGQDHTRDQVADYCLARGRDWILQEILDHQVNEQLLLSEAERAGIGVNGRTGDQALRIMLKPLLQPGTLKQYYESRREEFALIHTAYIILPKDDAAAFAPRRTAGPTPAIDELRARIAAGAIDFAEAARRYSICPATADRGGDLGYLAGSLAIAESVPPEAYNLDYVRTPYGARSPITTPPNPEIGAALEALADGGLSPSIELPKTRILVKRIETRYPTSFTALRPFLADYRFGVEKVRLLLALRAPDRLTLRWRPGTRPLPGRAGNASGVERPEPESVRSGGPGRGNRPPEANVLRVAPIQLGR